MTHALDFRALDQLFRHARSADRFLDQPVKEITLYALYDLVKYGPTGFNAQPARFVFIRSQAEREHLAGLLKGRNRDKVLSAPVTAVVAWDKQFHQHLPTLFPAFDARGYFEQKPEQIAPAGHDNALLQAGYLILAARALGLDAGPMGGFPVDALDGWLFPDGECTSVLLLALGYADRQDEAERLPRHTFATAVQLR
ncbi:3-hydroxypropanoate dehydrogenase [Andreprevotia lacus DSM 23236]|jgi:3-hydroxypropanoate dehydrogenase|uniref:3-hydroxypropanoate dehydrogenase n=1 Tax=Andreprevotia lacus DSM 23236 TaxID=1121001 RepID=A0A1W1XV09_9NEIS|nr:malonic semialdehyde reductase [Andreprevotia lacus]SMC27783.1 3-hydroxypropanoate dehydrogenase [Andreprevotia lacus DSM 23236]